MIPTLTINRGPSTPEGTFSKAAFHSDTAAFSLVTLELPDHDNEHSISSVLPGEYRATLQYSEHFGREVYLLHNVPGRDAIEIHPANWGGDEAYGYYSDLRGCIAPGLGIATLRTPKDGQQKAVTSSKKALDMIIDGADGEDIVVKIVVV